MTSMATTAVFVTGGVDTHGQTHHAAVLDYMGRQLGDREFPTSPAGYRALLQWMSGHGVLDRVGVEGTGTYGVGLARHLREAGVQVVEVDRPDRRARRAQGKSDPLDAYSAARAALSGRASVVPKVRDGKVEAIRAIRVARSSAVKARTQATNQLKAMIVTGSPRSVSNYATSPRRCSSPTVHGCVQAPTSATPNKQQRLRCGGLPAATSSCQQRSPKPTASFISWSVTSLLRCSTYPALGQRSPAKCSSASATTPTASNPKPRSLTCAELHQSPPAAAELIVTGSTAAVTAAQTTPST